jgi:peptidyl-prolyl cis-trans isomerase SurA
VFSPVRSARAWGLAALLLLTPDLAHAEGVVLDRVVAVVNDGIILESELERNLMTDPIVMAELQQLGPSATDQQRELKLRELRIEVLDTLITNRLMLAEAPRFQLSASEADVESYLQNLAQRNNMGTVDELKKAVEESGQFGTWAEYRAKLREEIIIYKVQNVLAAPTVTDAQVRERYRKMSRGEEAKVSLQRFTFKPDGSSAGQRDAAMAKAKQMSRRLAAGEDVDKLAEELSAPISEEFVTRREVSPQLGDAIFAAKPGEIVGPLESGQGFVVFKIVEVKASDLVGYEEAKAGLRAQLENEAIEKGGAELREQLRARAHVDIRL